ncbi:MAG: riboflavin synthase [Victivallales bacterium]|nr:riboflavin synthase [Victivallales bacterium]
MFTGLIEKQGVLRSKIFKKNMYEITFTVKQNWQDLEIGESIAVDGVCLTAKKFDADSFVADISLPTLKDTTLSKLKNGSKVNLERSLKVGGRLGGHIVQGHVDGTGRILSVRTHDNNITVKIAPNRKLLELIILKASIAVNGVSLTVQDKQADSFSVVIIPHSAENTNLPALKTGDSVNIEIDVLAKYVKHFLNSGRQENSLKSLVQAFTD